MIKMVLLGTITFLLTLGIGIAADVFCIFSMMLVLNGFMGGSDAFTYYIGGLPIKSAIVSLVSLWTVAILSHKTFFKTIVASILLVLLAVIVFSIINLVIDGIGSLGLVGYMDFSNRNRR